MGVGALVDRILPSYSMQIRRKMWRSNLLVLCWQIVQQEAISPGGQDKARHLTSVLTLWRSSKHSQGRLKLNITQQPTDSTAQWRSCGSLCGDPVDPCNGEGSPLVDDHSEYTLLIHMRRHPRSFPAFVVRATSLLLFHTT